VTGPTQEALDGVAACNQEASDEHDIEWGEYCERDDLHDWTPLIYTADGEQDQARSWVTSSGPHFRNQHLVCRPVGPWVIADEPDDQLAVLDLAAAQRAFRTAWNIIEPRIRPRDLSDMGEDDALDLRALRDQLAQLDPDLLLRISVIVSELGVEVHRQRGEALRAQQQEGS
jgi:hypothetical protein